MSLAKIIDDLNNPILVLECSFLMPVLGLCASHGACSRSEQSLTGRGKVELPV